MGRVTFTRALPPPADGRGADRGAALLPRPAARLDRRARADADERRGAHDLRGRSGFAPERSRGRDPRLRARDPRHRGGVRAAPRAGATVATRSRWRGRCTKPARGCRGSATRCTRPSTRGPSGSSSSPTSAEQRAAHGASARPARSRRRGLGQAADDERLDADRVRHARPRLSRPRP